MSVVAKSSWRGQTGAMGYLGQKMRATRVILGPSSAYTRKADTDLV
jgi:hypothetical protein